LLPVYDVCLNVMRRTSTYHKYFTISRNFRWSIANYFFPVWLDWPRQWYFNTSAENSLEIAVGCSINNRTASGGFRCCRAQDSFLNLSEERSHR
jgi:hypothetical protein